MECQVCQSPTVKLNHNTYGANDICRSCRQFFLRSVRASTFKIFQHAKEECKIDSLNRKSCKKCRFEKCLKAGMQVNYVSLTHSTNKKLAEILTVDEENYLTKLHKTCIGKLAGKCCRFYAENLHLAVKFFVQKPAFFTNSDLDLLWKVDKYIFTEILNFIDPEEISKTEKLKLFEHNFNRIHQFLMAYWLSNHQNFMKNYLSYCENMNPKILDTMKNGFNLSYCYDTLFSSPWAPNFSIEEEHANLMKKMGDWTVQASEKKNFVIILVILILFLQVDQGLEKMSNAEKLQQHYISLLYKSFKTDSSNSRKELHTALMMIHESQRTYDLSLMRLQLDEEVA